MSTYLIGDVHGCYNNLMNILEKISFNPKIDTLWFTGDLVSKGPNSLEVLRLIYTLNDSVHLVLGNHDLHLLSIYAGINKQNKFNDHFKIILQAHDIDKIMNWLRQQPFIQIHKKKKIIMSHAGINPTWNLNSTIQYAEELKNILHDHHYYALLEIANGLIPTKWNINYNDIIRIKNNIESFTKMRYCFPNGKLAINYKKFPIKKNIPLIPWFNMPNLILPDYNIIFGHWSSLQGKGTPKGIYGLDYGCYWSGILTALKWEDKTFIYSS